MSHPAILTPEQLKSLKMGDEFTTEGLFLGLTSEPIKWVLIGGNIDIYEYVFRVTYMGVLLGEFCARIKALKKSEKVMVEEL